MKGKVWAGCNFLTILIPKSENGVAGLFKELISDIE
jgi:hypothetical protein